MVIPSEPQPVGSFPEHNGEIAMTRLPLTLAACCLAAMLTACGGGDPAQPAASSASSAEPAEAPLVGSWAFDSDGMIAYAKENKRPVPAGGLDAMVGLIAKRAPGFTFSKDKVTMTQGEKTVEGTWKTLAHGDGESRIEMTMTVNGKPQTEVMIVSWTSSDSYRIKPDRKGGDMMFMKRAP